MAHGIVVGSTRLIEALFTDADNDPVDPDDVTFEFQAPDGTITAIPESGLDNPVVGTWQYVLDLTAAGVWRTRFEGVTGDATAVEEAVICVHDSVFAGASS